MDRLLYLYVRKVAVLSSQIEGTQSTLSDLLEYENDAAPGTPLDDVQEVSRYVAALLPWARSDPGWRAGAFRNVQPDEAGIGRSGTLLLRPMRIPRRGSHPQAKPTAYGRLAQRCEQAALDRTDAE